MMCCGVQGVHVGHPRTPAAAVSKQGASLRQALLRFSLCAGAVCWLGVYAAGPVWAQTPGAVGPQTPSRLPEVRRIPTTTPVPDKPPIPPEEIIRRFAAHEDEMARASQGYTYRKVVRLQEFGPDGKPNGQSEIITNPAVTDDGRRYQRTTGEQQSTLQLLSLERDTLQFLAQIPAFPLGTAQLSKYQITYAGTQPVDELMTYVFLVKPLRIERTIPYFDGLIWVDSHDLAIVKSFGKWVVETGPVSPPQLPFIMYETYRQPVDNKYWMPAFSQSDNSVATKEGNVPVRLIMRWDNYAPAPPSKIVAPAGSPAAAPAPAPSSTTGSPANPER